MLRIQDNMYIFMQRNWQAPHRSMRNKQNLTIVYVMVLAFLFLNIRTVTQKKILLEQLLQDEQINTFMLNETNLTAKMHCKIK